MIYILLFLAFIVLFIFSLGVLMRSLGFMVSSFRLLIKKFSVNKKIDNNSDDTIELSEIKENDIKTISK